jgi:hypothetical protein
MERNGVWLMLHIWLIPALAVLILLLSGLYLLIRFKGGSGVRTEGKTMLDKPGEDQDLPPG